MSGTDKRVAVPAKDGGFCVSKRRRDCVRDVVLLRFVVNAKPYDYNINLSAPSVGVGDSTTRRASAPFFRDGEPVPYDFKTHVCLPPVGYGIYDVPYVSLVQRKFPYEGKCREPTKGLPFLRRKVPSSARRRDCKMTYRFAVLI